jgi:hypothetical protein
MRSDDIVAEIKMFFPTDQKIPDILSECLASGAIKVDPIT